MMLLFWLLSLALMIVLFLWSLINMTDQSVMFINTIQNSHRLFEIVSLNVIVDFSCIFLCGDTTCPQKSRNG